MYMSVFFFVLFSFCFVLLLFLLFCFQFVLVFNLDFPRIRTDTRTENAFQLESVNTSFAFSILSCKL